MFPFYSCRNLQFIFQNWLCHVRIYSFGLWWWWRLEISCHGYFFKIKRSGSNIIPLHKFRLQRFSLMWMSLMNSARTKSIDMLNKLKVQSARNSNVAHWLSGCEPHVKTWYFQQIDRVCTQILNEALSLFRMYERNVFLYNI